MKESKHVTSEQSSSSTNKKSGGTPIKKLISEEMMGDTESRQKTPSVVARLMGLDSLPVQKSVVITEKVRNKGNVWDEDLQHSQQQKYNYFDKSMECNDQPFFHEEAFRDVYEEQQQPTESVCFEGQSLQKERYYDKLYQLRMNFVQQKLNEAKLMPNDEMFIDSKEFKDAVNVYSNRDLIFKFLDKPNSLLAKHLFDLQRVPLPSHKTQITLLKPFNIIEKKSEKCIDRQSFAASSVSSRKANNHSWISGFSELKGRSLSQSTRIVVLKPSPWKADSLKTKHPKNMPTLLDGCVSNGAMTNDKLTNAREVAKEITHPIRESLSSNKDELFLSSVLSNGYIGDESSFNRSGSEDIEGDIGCTCGTESTTPAKEYFCDYMNKNGSPLSISSFTRQFHSPESSVFREAKRRLSERLALVASNDICQEQKELQRTSSTLGEVLAIPEIISEGNKDELDLSSSKSLNVKSSGKVSSVFPSSSRSEDEFPGEYSHGSLSKSKPVSLSSSACQVDGLNVEISGSLIGKPIVPTSNSGRSSFKDIFSSFFFSKSKKPSRENSFRCPSKDKDRVQSQSSNISCQLSDDLLQSSNETPLAHVALYIDKLHDESTEVILSPKDQNSFSQTLVVDNVDNGVAQSCRGIIVEHPEALSRSPPIESIVRSSSRSISCLDTASCHSLDSPLDSSSTNYSLHMDDEETKRTVNQSRHKLLFDAVSAALVDINQSAIAACHGPQSCYVTDVSASEEIWATLKSKLSGEKCVPQDSMSINEMVDILVKDEVTGREWAESKLMEVYEFCKDIAEMALVELLEQELPEL
ncbi:uncharacterized protein LOC141834103 [Curcuma longa]|uniref:uncharacterized protein LOC141834103 n=1 Tax=Curcuma longa TaxID=136217 RepID=UPI003D9DD9EC